jgi:hypothetical protein
VTQVQQRFGKVRTLAESLAVQPDGVVKLATLLQDQPGVVEQLRTPLAAVNQLRLTIERCLEVFAFGTLETFGGLLPFAELLETHRQVEGGGRVARVNLEELGVAMRSFLELLELELDVAASRVNLRRRLSMLDRQIQFAQSVFELALQM